MCRGEVKRPLLLSWLWFSFFISSLSLTVSTASFKVMRSFLLTLRTYYSCSCVRVEASYHAVASEVTFVSVCAASKRYLSTSLVNSGRQQRSACSLPLLQPPSVAYSILLLLLSVSLAQFLRSPRAVSGSSLWRRLQCQVFQAGFYFTFFAPQPLLMLL